MKTGVVMEIDGDTAVVMQPGGAFLRSAARPGWEVGSVVQIDTERPKVVLFRRLALAAACLVVLAGLGLGARSVLFATASVISVDINPSVELELNRRGRVVAVNAYNDDGSAMAEDLDLAGKPYQEAVPLLLSSPQMQPYLAAGQVLEFSVYSETDEAALMAFMSGQGEAAAAHHPQLKVHCTGVGQEVVEQAHEHGVSAGKMKALLELGQLDPGIDIEEYSRYSMSELRRMIREMGGVDAGNEGAPGAQDDSGHGAGNGSGGQGNGEGGGHHNGNGRCSG